MTYAALLTKMSNPLTWSDSVVAAASVAWRSLRSTPMDVTPGVILSSVSCGFRLRSAGEHEPECETSGGRQRVSAHVRPFAAKVNLLYLCGFS